MTDLAHELERRIEAPQHKTVEDLIARMRPELEKVLPREIGFERFARIVLTEIRRTPKLYDCDPHSLLGAMMLAAQLGLEPGPLGHVYLIPFRQEVSFVIGYRGMIDLAYRSGLLKKIETGTVRDGDEFKYRLGTRAFLDHVPLGPPAEREATHYYAVAALKTGGNPFVVLAPEEVEKHRKRSRNATGDYSPWTTDYDAMARKTCIRVLAKVLPQSPQFAHGLEADDATIAGLDAVDPLEADAATGAV